MLACAAYSKGVARVRAMATPFSVHTATVPRAIFEPPREYTAAAGAAVLEHLVGRPAASFWRDVWEREPLHVRASTAPSTNLFGRLLQLADIDSLLERGASVYAETRTPLANFHDVSLVKRLERDGLPWTGRWGAENETLGVETLKRGFNAGFSLLVNDVEARVAAVAAACSALESYTRILCNANLYLTPAGAQGFDAHYDWMDGLVVQLDGAKRWRLYPPIVALPRADLTRKPTAAELAALPAAAEVVLREGDVLYLPRGTLHEASTPADQPQSLHLTIGLNVGEGVTLEGLVHAALDELAAAGTAVRRPAAAAAASSRRSTRVCARRRRGPSSRACARRCRCGARRLSSTRRRAWRRSTTRLTARSRCSSRTRARRRRRRAPRARTARDARRAARSSRPPPRMARPTRGGSHGGSGRRCARRRPRWSSGRCGASCARRRPRRGAAAAARRSLGVARRGSRISENYFCSSFSS